jgi:TPR repeat protein
MSRLGIVMLLALIAGWPRAGLGDQFEDATWAYEAGDYIAAAKLWRPLAKLGDIRAQWVLGLMNEDGHGVARDVVRAHVWYNLAGANGHRKARRSRDALAKNMTPAQIAEAQDRAKEWLAENLGAWPWRNRRICRHLGNARWRARGRLNSSWVKNMTSVKAPPRIMPNP